MPLLPLCSQIYVGATVNSLLGDTFSRKNNTHGSRLHDRDPQFASRILGAMTQSCYIGTRDIRSRVIRGPYCFSKFGHENPWSRSCVWSKVKVTFDLQNSTVKVMVMVKPIGHIWGLEVNQCVCFSFRGNRTTFGWDIANSIFDLENLRSRSRSWPRSNLMVIFEP